MAFNLGRSFSIISALRLTPGRLRKELRRNFKIVLTGSKDLTASFYEVLTKGVNLEVPAVEKEEKLKEFIEVIPAPIDDETRRKIKSDLLLYILSEKDTNEEYLRNYWNLYKTRPPALCFIQEPKSLEKKEEIERMLDYLFISGFDWLAAPSEENIRKKAEIILKLNQKYDVALAFRFPILREEMAKKLIHDTGVQNMIIALASSLPTNLPIIGIIIGLLAVAGETTVLTVNQLKLCLQLAGLYGLNMSILERIKELWPLVGSALGLRAVARSLVGFIPLAGPTIKGAIAYGGTYMVGETVRWYYEKGRKLTEEERKNLLEEAKWKAREAAEKYLAGFKKMAGKTTGKVEKKKESYNLEDFEESLKELEKEIHEMDVEEYSAHKDIVLPEKKKKKEKKPVEVKEKPVVPKLKIKMVKPAVIKEKPIVEKAEKAKKKKATPKKEEKPKVQKAKSKKVVESMLIDAATKIIEEASVDSGKTRIIPESASPVVKPEKMKKKPGAAPGKAKSDKVKAKKEKKERAKPEKPKIKKEEKPKTVPKKAKPEKMEK